MIDIDLVYLWVNGNDPMWIAKRNACIGKPSVAEENCKGRYVDNDELKYSLRSVEKYAPWIRRIFIVTDNQIPTWLDTTHPKIQIVDHTEILPQECLPCFNCRILEHHIHLIPGLSEHFLFANDDMLINKAVTPEDFFAPDLLPIVRLWRKPFRKWNLLFKTKVLGKQLRNRVQTIHNTALLVERRYGVYYNSKPHHNIDAYLKSDYLHTRQTFDNEISATLTNHARGSNDVQRTIYTCVPLAEKRAHLRYVSQNTSFCLNIEDRTLYKKFQRYDPMLFCVNDSQYANDDDREYAKAFLCNLFPDKSQFEK